SILHSLGLDDQQIDYVKMDIEGAEGTVLANAGAWLDRAQAITVEIHDRVTHAQCEGWLSRRGFACRAHSGHLSAVVAERA
ncbi:MAG TPA: FkbM family methyltransferase, partial [Vicinamibacterales bacterium]|nr:FkbM family methyltransferase [Vicinamibacterales bacterium]